MKRTLSSSLFLAIIFSFNSHRLNASQDQIKDLTFETTSIYNGASTLPQGMTGLSLEEKNSITLGELVLLEACKKGDLTHAKKMVLEQKVNPNTKNPQTGITPFGIALHTNRELAAFLLENGAKPHAHLKMTESLYSESFRRGNIQAIQFLLKKYIPYSPKKNHCDLARYRKQDLKRLLIAGNYIPVCQAFVSGLLTRETVTPKLLALARKYKKTNPHFDPKIITILTNISSKSDETLKRLQKRKPLFTS